VCVDLRVGKVATRPQFRGASSEDQLSLVQMIPFPLENFIYPSPAAAHMRFVDFEGFRNAVAITAPASKKATSKLRRTQQLSMLLTNDGLRFRPFDVSALRE